MHVNTSITVRTFIIKATNPFSLSNKPTLCDCELIFFRHVDDAASCISSIGAHTAITQGVKNNRLTAESH